MEYGLKALSNTIYQTCDGHEHNTYRNLASRHNTISRETFEGENFCKFQSLRAICKSFLHETLGHATPTYVWFQASHESFLCEILTSYGSMKVFSLESLPLYGNIRARTCPPVWAGGYTSASSSSPLSFCCEYHSHNPCRPRGVKTPVVCSALFLDSQVDNIMISLQDSGVGSLQLCMFFQVLDPLKERQPIK